MHDGALALAMSSPVPSESSGSTLSRASTIERGLDQLQGDSEATESLLSSVEASTPAPTPPLSTLHPHLSLLLDVFRRELPEATANAIQDIIDRVLNKQVALTQPEFIRLLHLVAKEDIGALRRACQMGKRQLESCGWRPRSRPSPLVQPSPASRPSRARAGRVASGWQPEVRSKGINKGASNAFARLRARQVELAGLDECHDGFTHLKL